MKIKIRVLRREAGHSREGEMRLLGGGGGGGRTGVRQNKP